MTISIRRAYPHGWSVATVLVLAVLSLIVSAIVARPADATAASDFPTTVTNLDGSAVGVQSAQVPIIAGDRVLNPRTANVCTVGGVLEPSYTELARTLGLRSATRWLFTSGHCGEVGDVFYTAPGHVYIGRVNESHYSPDNPDTDFLTIVVPPTIDGSVSICPPGSNAPSCLAPNVRLRPRALSGRANCYQSPGSSAGETRIVSGLAANIPSGRVLFCGAESGFWRGGSVINPTSGMIPGSFIAHLDQPSIGGDSGGPMYVRIGNSDQFQLVGILRSGLTYAGTSAGYRFIGVEGHIFRTGHVFV